MFDGWVSGASNNPEKPPQLNSERLVRLSKEEISELIAADRLSGDDVMKPLKDDATGKLDALLRLSSFPEFESSWQNYLSTHWNKWAELERPRRHSIALYSTLYQLHQRIVSLGEDNPIELVWGIGVALWQRETVRVCSHIIEQPVESDLEVDGTIVLRPRAVYPTPLPRRDHRGHFRLRANRSTGNRPPTPGAAKAQTMPTHERLGTDDRENLRNRRNPAIQ